MFDQLIRAVAALAAHRAGLVGLLLIWCALDASPASVDSARYRFDVWTTENGLPQNTVLAIVQTRDGYLWLATLDGLVRFDGVRFTIFNTSNSKGIGSNRLSSLLEDSQGNLWFGTQDGGVTRYRDGTFITYTTEEGLPGNMITGIQTDDEGGVLVSTSNGLVRWWNGKFSPLTVVRCQPHFINRSKSPIFWCADNASLYVLNRGKEIALGIQNGLASREVSSVYEDREGNLWIGTTKGALSKFKDGSFTFYGDKDLLTDNPVITILEDREGAMWLGTGAGGVLRFKDGQYTAYTTADGLSDNSVISIFEDREGIIWVGTFNGGLNRMNKEVITAFSKKDGLAANNIYPIYEDRAGNIWIATWPVGLTRYGGGKFTYYTKRDRLPGAITAITEDREGRIWVGAYSGVASLKDGEITPLADPTGLSPHYVSAIYEDRNGALWFGTNNGLSRNKDGTRRVYTTNEGLAGNDVRAILEDRRGDLWVGSYGGLTRIRDDTLTAYTKQDGLASNQVRSLYEDDEGVIWIGTYDGGLSRLKDGKFTVYTTRDGLYNNGVFQILEDDGGNLWMSSNLGIYRVSKQQLEDFADGKIKSITSVPYGRRDGMLNIECNGGTQPAGIRRRDGKLWFPTQAGIAIVDTGAVSLNTAPPPVVIEDVLLDRAAVDWPRDRQALEIGPDRESLEIHYTGLSFINSEQVRFRYRLEGLDSDWVDAGTRRAVYYSHLPPGSYTFRVIAANSDGVWSQAGASIQIQVIPPFWRRWWFVTLAVGIVAAVSFLIYERRVWQLRKAKSAQEAFSRQLIQSQERERKRIAGELHDSLGQNLLVIKNWALLGMGAMREDDPGKSELNEISTTVSQAIDEVREIAYNLRPYQLDELGLTRALTAMIRKVGAVSSVGFSTEIAPLDNLLSKESEINLYRVVQESVNNIVKHSGATQASVIISNDLRNLLVTITDNGKGFTPDANADGRTDGTGFGLKGISERVRMLGGKHAIHSGPAQGTKISISIRLDGLQEDRRDDN